MKLTTSTLLLLCFSTSCSNVPIVKDWVQWTGGKTTKISDLEPPGYFDVGMGFGIFTDRPLVETHSTGVLLSVKAYPTGRWYSKPKGAQAKILAETSREVAFRNLLTTQVSDQATLQSTLAAGYAHSVLGLDAANIRSALAVSDDSAKPLITKALAKYRGDELKKNRTASEKGPVIEALDVFDEAPVVDWILAYAKDSNINASAAWAPSSDHLKDDPAKTLYAAIQAKATAPVSITASQALALTPEFQMLSNAESRDWVVVEGRTNWHHRLSMFYGYTLDELEGQIQDHLHVVGVAYDVAPQFSLLAGFGFHSNDGVDMMGGDAHSGLFLGTSLNLNTFKSAFKALVGGS